LDCALAIFNPSSERVHVESIAGIDGGELAENKSTSVRACLPHLRRRFKLGAPQMKLRRRYFLHLAAGAAALPAVAHTAEAQSYPSRPVHIIVGYAAGGPTDILARLIGQWLSERLGQPFVIEDRPGAATNVATEAVAHAPPDGYTLLAAVSTNTINPALYPNLNFNFIRDIAMIAGLTRSAEVLEVNPALPIRSVSELIAYVKTNPGKLSLASFGTGTISHVAGVMFKKEAGIEMVHVPYRGSAPLVVDLLAGQVAAAFDNIQSSIGYIKAGKLRALAVTSATRLPWLPDVPALADFLPGYEVTGWIGVAAPKNTPTAIIDRLNEEINAGLADPQIAARVADMASTVFIASPADLDKLVIKQTAKWSKVVEGAGIKGE
jgi:tripartite-type tricarboxylate transporter receptor subunit TctC